MADCGYLQSQLTSILNSLVKIAVVELLRVVEDSAVELRLEVSQIKLENQALTIENESNKTKIQSLEAELLTAGKRQCSYCCRAVEYLSPKADRDVAVPFAFSEAHDASWLQQSEYARTVEKSIATRNAVKQYLIKKEQQGEIQGSTQTGISTEVPGEQPCPKVDMVFDKEWSQVLWQGGGFKEDGESSGQEEEDTPGFKDDGDSSGQDEDDTPGPSAIHRQMKPDWALKWQNVCVGPSVIADGVDCSDPFIQKPEKKCRKLRVGRVEENKKNATKMYSVLPNPDCETYQNNTVSSDGENILAFGSSEPGSCLNFEQNTSLTSPVTIVVPKCVKPLGAAEIMDTHSYINSDKIINSSKCNVDIETNIEVLGKRGNGMGTDFRKRNVNYCFVCGKPQLKISRHLRRHMKENAEIAHMLSLDVDSKQRRVLMEKIRNKGNFQHNTEVISKGSGSLKVKRRTRPTSSAKRYELCVFCKGMFVRQELWRHRRRCPCKPEGIDQKFHYGKKRFILEVGHNSGNINKN